MSEIINPNTGVDLSEIFDEAPTVVRDTRKRMADVIRVVNSQTILSPDETTTLADKIVTCTTSSGDYIWAASDKGIGYKQVNEDCVMVHPAYNLSVVIDGMGGGDKAKLAAQMTAWGFIDFPDNPQSALKRVSKYMKKEKINPEKDGACFASARVINDAAGKALEIAKAGDVKVILFDENYKIIWQSTDDSAVQSFIDKGTITPDQALYSPFANSVTKSISSDRYEFTLINQRVKKGWKAMIATDGVVGNIIPEEIQSIISGKGFSPREIITVLSNFTNNRMMNAMQIYHETERQGGRHAIGKYSDGFLAFPHPDNRSLVIVEIN